MIFFSGRIVTLLLSVESAVTVMLKIMHQTMWLYCKSSGYMKQARQDESRNLIMG